MPTRREVISGLGGLAAAYSLGADHTPVRRPAPAAVDGFPRRTDFDIAPGHAYINGAYTHPMPSASAEAYRAVVTRRGQLGYPQQPSPTRPDARAAFADLINARPHEIAWIQNTSFGENLVIEALGLNRPFDGNIVTDDLHFEGALIHLMELQKRGADIRIARSRNGAVDIEDLARLVDRKTRLVEVSFVSMYNGFQHDLKAVCDLAHAHGAYVYADLIQGVGAVPLDVRAVGLDFGATATYKWMMGDFGMGFFYVREDLMDRVLGRPHWSYNSAPDAAIHLSPHDPQYPQAVTYTPGRDAASHVQLGTTASAIAAALSVSVPYIRSLGVDNIQAHRIPLLQKLQRELPRLGWTPQTPTESTSPIVTFALKDSSAVGRKLAAANVNVRVADYWIRISPSVYNDMADVDQLLNALT